ncbi:sulfatase (plasmid) [Haloferax sp. S1W]|uniref:sulfatase n=1 Tax=Haloferax sp. S1W TaxID=3377110 RepID=UPI0037CA015E
MNGRDIIWITLESVRRDRTSLSDHSRDTTPFIRRLATDGDGTSFSNCVSHAIWTRPSSTSILTGRAPSDHRVWSYDAALSRDITTIPEQLRARGYRTVAVSPIAQVSPATGLDKGFDHFHYLGKKQLLHEVGLPTILKYVANIHEHSAGFTRDTTKHSRGFFTQSVATRHIDRAAADREPLFLYVHLGDSHHAYYPPKRWNDRFVDDLDLPLDDALDVVLRMSNHLHEYITRGLPFDDAEWNAIEILYDTCLAYVDSIAESIVQCAQERLDDPLIVITADHGESFGEHGLLAHMLVPHSGVTDVPLVVSGFDVPAGVEHGLVQPADVMAMISTECELALEVPIGQDVRAVPRDFAVTQRGSSRPQNNFAKFREYDPAFDVTQFPAGEVNSIRNTDYRYQRSDDRTMLYDLADETTSIHEDHPDVIGLMDKALDGWLDAYGRASGGEERTARFSSDMKAQLRDLGYL